jgi:hypothetical protein
LDDNQGIPFEEAYDHRMMPADKPDDNQGHVDPSSQNLMMGKSYVEGNAISLSSKMPPPYVQLFDLCLTFSGINPVHENLQALQPQLSQFGDMLQQGKYFMIPALLSMQCPNLTLWNFPTIPQKTRNTTKKNLRRQTPGSQENDCLY